jgi:hypothetical protein
MRLFEVKKVENENEETAEDVIKYTNAPWNKNTVINPITAYFFNLTFL